MMTHELALFGTLAKYYDLLYQFKNYEQEAHNIIELIHEFQPQAKTLLDMGCGTAKHLHYFKQYFDCIGADCNASMLSIARANEPTLEFFQANMQDMHHEKKFDVITCLFSSIGYMTTEKALLQAWETFHRHLNMGGTVIVEPWFSPEHYRVGSPFSTHYEDENLKITRMNVTKRHEDLALLNFHYLIAEKNKEVQYYQDSHEMYLIEPERMLSLMEAAGFKAIFYQVLPFEERGMFVGVKR